MFYLIMLFWIGKQLIAPTWYWVLWGVICFGKFLNFGFTMYKKGAKIE